MERRRRFRGGVVALVLSLAIVAAVALRSWSATPPRLCDALVEHGVATVSLVDGADLRCDGVVSHTASTALRQALVLREVGPLQEELARQKASALALVGGRAAGAAVEARLARYEAVPGLEGVVLSPRLVVAGARPLPALSVRERDALAYVARAILNGAREPQAGAFPAALRKFARVEVMVALKERGQPVLWRSARSTSVARALLTATRVARDRFRERESSLGGPLQERLLRLDVDVSLLVDDGDLADLSRGFVDAAVTREHGIGYDHRGSWYYVLPSELARRVDAGEREAAPYEALLALLRDHGSSEDALAAEDMRVYRFRELLLGSSRAPLAESPPPERAKAAPAAAPP